MFFVDDYVRTLVTKHGLMRAAMTGTLVLTVHAWRTKPGAGTGLWRALLGLNLLLALAIAGAAAVGALSRDRPPLLVTAMARRGDPV